MRWILTRFDVGSLPGKRFVRHMGADLAVIHKTLSLLLHLAVLALLFVVPQRQILGVAAEKWFQ